MGGPILEPYLDYLEAEPRDTMGLVVVHMVVSVDGGCTVARLLNPTDQELKQYPGSHLGVCHHVDASHIASVSSEVFDHQPVDAVGCRMYPVPHCLKIRSRGFGQLGARCYR